MIQREDKESLQSLVKNTGCIGRTSCFSVSGNTKPDEKYLLTAGKHQYFVRVWH